MRPAGPEQARRPHSRRLASTPLTIRLLRKPNRRRIARRDRLHRQEPSAVAKVISPLCAARHAEAELQHQRQQERLRALGDAGQRARDHREPEGRHPHQRQVQDRVCRRARAWRM